MSKDAIETLNFNMTMFSREQDFLRYMRMNTRSDMIQQVYDMTLERVACNEVIYLPMIDGLSLTLEQITRYEQAEAKPSKQDRITPLISRALRRQNVDFFRDARSYNERQSVMVRVLYHQPLAFEAKEVRLEKGKDRA